MFVCRPGTSGVHLSQERHRRRFEDALAIYREVGWRLGLGRVSRSTDLPSGLVPWRARLGLPWTTLIFKMRQLGINRRQTSALPARAAASLA